MSEPKRYSLRMPDISYGTEESPKGEFVLWLDYARLNDDYHRLLLHCEALETELLEKENKQ